MAVSTASKSRRLIMPLPYVKPVNRPITSATVWDSRCIRCRISSTGTSSMPWPPSRGSIRGHVHVQPIKLLEAYAAGGCQRRFGEDLLHLLVRQDAGGAAVATVSHRVENLVRHLQKLRNLELGNFAVPVVVLHPKNGLVPPDLVRTAEDGEAAEHFDEIHRAVSVGVKDGIPGGQ